MCTLVNICTAYSAKIQFSSQNIEWYLSGIPGVAQEWYSSILGVAWLDWRVLTHPASHAKQIYVHIHFIFLAQRSLLYAFYLYIYYPFTAITRYVQCVANTSWTFSYKERIFVHLFLLTLRFAIYWILEQERI